MIVDILEEHLDEAQHLFWRRTLAVQGDTTSAELADLDQRMWSHIDGLLLGGEATWRLCAPFLAGGTMEQAFVAAIVAMEDGHADRVRALEQALAAATDEVLEGLRWAAKLARSAVVVPCLRGLLE